MRSLLDSLGRTVQALHLGEDRRRLSQLARRLLRGEGLAEVPEGPPAPTPPLLERLLGGDDRGLDVGLCATLLAWEDAPEAVDVGRTLALLDELAARGRQRLQGAAGPAAQLAAFNRFFFEELGFAAPPGRGRPERDSERLGLLLLPWVVRRRRGHCVGLSTAYLALGYRLGLPLFGVSAPGHFFVRWEGGGLRENVETTARGQALPDAAYAERFRIAPGLVDRGVYLQSLRRREVLVEVLNNRANLWWDRGDLARASRDLDRVVHVSHNFHLAWLARGLMALTAGDPGRARLELERALAVDPELPRAHLLLGEVALREGALDAAEASFRAALTAPEQALALTNLGRVEARRGRADQAVAWHERALEQDPACHLAWNNLGVARQAQGADDLARRAFRRAVELAPAFLPARENLVLLGRARGRAPGWRERTDFLAVSRAYEQRLRRNPGDDELRAGYVRFLSESGQRTDRALALARAAVAARPTPRNLESLARVLWRSGRTAQALATLEQALAGPEGGGQGPDEGRLRRTLERWRRRDEGWSSDA